MMGLGSTASAQAPGQVEPASAPFLEKRVPEELATEGIVLSRRNLALQVEQLGDKWLVSLVDLTTGRVAASTKVDALPADREAAVATMTHVVSELAAQIVGRSEPPPSPPPVAAPPPPPPLPVVIDDRAEREQREIAELKYRRQSLRFGENLQLTATRNTAILTRSWVVYQGDLDQELAPTEFYDKVGRPDLVAGYTQRRNVAIGGLIVSGAAVVIGTAVLLNQTYTSRDCPLTGDLDAISMCENEEIREDIDHRNQQLVTIGVSLGVFTIGLGIGFYYYGHPHPISENEAKALADAYNQRLRRELGLPVVTRQPLLHDVKLTPFVARGDAGLMLGARF